MKELKKIYMLEERNLNLERSEMYEVRVNSEIGKCR